MLSAEQQNHSFLSSNVSRQNNSGFTVKRLNGTEEMGEAFHTSSHLGSTLKETSPRLTKTPDSFLFKFSIGLIFAITPVNLLTCCLTYKCCGVKLMKPRFFCLNFSYLHL